MAIPKITNEGILKALQYIDENGIPEKNKSTQYVLEANNGKEYPPKYVIAVANHLENDVAIDTNSYNAEAAKQFLQSLGYKINTKQERFELIISSDEIVSSDRSFNINNLNEGDWYKPIDVYFETADGERVTRNYNKGERRNSNQTLPRLAFQVFEKQIASLSEWDRDRFPVCQYRPEEKRISGIYLSIDEFRKKYSNSIEYMIYTRENGPQFVMYCWSIFSNIYFVQECLKRFGNPGDRFVLTYRRKTEQEKNPGNLDNNKVNNENPSDGCKIPNSKIVLQSRNVIFRGAPGTGKSYLAKEIAADIISNGYTDRYTDLTDEQKAQVEFVQFHPSYDYTDFVEGLRPKMNVDGSIGFELQDGIFKKFVEKARQNYENSKDNPKKYIFIIDEINRGEISKILGELFFSIDPGYRGKAGEVSTQYSNMHKDPTEKFYIPENVYIIGTMNDIDRSVDSFDFAMRRRFRFVEIKAEDTQDMLEDCLVEAEMINEAIKRMNRLNEAIKNVPDLNENYQVGASYFRNVKEVGFDKLWTDYLQPLLQDYVRGMYDEEEHMKSFEKAYGYSVQSEAEVDEGTED